MSSLSSKSLNYIGTINCIPLYSKDKKDSKFIEDYKFTNWVKKLSSNFNIRKIFVNDVHWFGSKLGFVNCEAEAYDRIGDIIPGISLIRGNCCAVLIILECEGIKYAVNVTESRVPVACMHTQAVSGMLDEEGYPGGRIVNKVINEVKEETGIDISNCEIINMSERIQKIAASKGLSVSKYWKTSAGTTDEGIINFALKQKISPENLKKLNNRVMYNKSENEKCFVSYVPLEHFGMIADSKNKALINDYNILMKENHLPESWYHTPWYKTNTSIIIGMSCLMYTLSKYL